MENRHQCDYCSYNHKEICECNLVYLGYADNKDGKMNYPIGDTCPSFTDCCDGIPDDYLEYLEEIETKDCAKTEHSCRYCCRAIRDTQNASQFFCIAEEPYGGYGAGKERNLEDSKKVNNCPRFLPCSRDLFEE